jgi:hypothetical protein
VTSSGPSRRAKEAVRLWRRIAMLPDPNSPRYRKATESEEQTLTRLLRLTAAGWTLLIDRRWPAGPALHSHLMLVGPGGVFVVDVRAPDARAEEIDRIRAGAEAVEDALAPHGLSGAAVTPLLVLTAGATETRSGRVWLVGVSAVLPALLRLPHRLDADAIRTLAAALDGYEPLFLHDSGVEPAVVDADAVAHAQVVGQSAAALPRWMTFLDADQLTLVRRHFGGPARISGAPGTGKTVVGLHRAARLAARGRGPILYVSPVQALTRVQQKLFGRLAPDLTDTVEFACLHDWAVDLLRIRGHRPALDIAEECFAAAWEGHGGALSPIEPDPRYWHDEIAYVIKGRGLADLESYLELPRPGRRVPLQRAQRHAVWELYEAYEGIKKQRELVDHADILLDALAEVRRAPLTPRYASVIADEVQDLTLTAVRLLHELVGDAPDGLVLIGDAQQAVYPVGFHLAEAQITIRGARAETLRRNFRNPSAILQAAAKVGADDPYDDLDGTTRTGRPPVEATVHSGRMLNVVARTEAELDRALVAIVRDLGEVRAEGLAGVALLAPTLSDVDHYRALLAGESMQSLDRYDGGPTPALTIGTFHRCKGLEFSVVLLPRFDAAVQGARTGRATAADRVPLANRQLYVAMTRARDLLWLGQVVSR